MKTENERKKTTIDNVAINDVLPLKAARRDAIGNLKCFWNLRHQRRNFGDYIYIHYAVPPYSTRISAIYFLPFDNVLLGFDFRVQRVKHNAEFTKGGWELWSYFKPFVDQSSRNFQAM